MHVETTSTQIGEVVPAATMTTLSLNGRSFTDLLAIQPGVIPVTTMQSDSIIMAGVTGAVAPSGQLNPGNLSISGQRESANSFLVNGSDVQERMNGGTSIVPDLDSVDQFRVLTSNFDPQYGNYNGGIVSVITKSGSDAFHGSAFDFVRNTALDEKNYFSPERAEFKQQQPGGTVGGPIKKGKVFFFGDYQGTRTTQGIETGLIPVPTLAERAGNFSTDPSALTGTVNGPYWASLLSQRLGYPVSPGEPYYTPGCTSSATVRAAERDHPDAGVVVAGAAPAPVHPDAQRGRRRVFDRRVRADRARRQRIGPRRRQQPAGSAVRPTTSSTTTGWTIRIPARRAAPTCRGSTH